MKNLFQHVGNVSEKDTFEEAVKKTENGLMEDISLHNECRQDFLKSYRGVFNEMWTTDDIVLKGNQAVLPVYLWANATGLAHEGHHKHAGFLE